MLIGWSLWWILLMMLIILNKDITCWWTGRCMKGLMLRTRTVATKRKNAPARCRQFIFVFSMGISTYWRDYQYYCEYISVSMPTDWTRLVSHFTGTGFCCNKITFVSNFNQIQTKTSTHLQMANNWLTFIFKPGDTCTRYLVPASSICVNCVNLKSRKTPSW